MDEDGTVKVGRGERQEDEEKVQVKKRKRMEEDPRERTEYKEDKETRVKQQDLTCLRGRSTTMTNIRIGPSGLGDQYWCLETLIWADYQQWKTKEYGWCATQGQNWRTFTISLGTGPQQVQG